ncbi:MAG: NAD-dependent deacylase [Methanomassiliicoccales archaeon]|nr:MAG: NAD-dependent deacylase [Methanomassiliicoccales archaeon]
MMTEEERIKEACRWLSQFKNIAILTGAGISKESGIPTFRGKDGMWKKYRVEEMATPYAFQQDPRKVWEWYDWRRQLIMKANPNPAHRTIAEMENIYPKFTVITQNVDGLHKRAGCKNLIELHGNIWRARCIDEERIFGFTEVPLRHIPPQCECGSLIRPDVVWFGEPMPKKEVAEAFTLAEECDVMMVVGTSALVAPAASLPYAAKKNHAYIIEVNLESTPITTIADVSLFGMAGEILPELWSNVKKELDNDKSE